jgi:Lrp/AsnC family transcriptional regulator for asnA, asnC and gidA
MGGTEVKIDETDVCILKALLKDARTNFAEIARECGVSTNTIVKHFYKLQQSGVITGTATIVDLKFFGYQFPLSVDINVEAGKENLVLNMLRKMPSIRSYYQVIGKYDIHAVFHIRSFDEIEQIRNTIKREKAVERVGLTASLTLSGYFPENLSIQPTETNKNGRN